MLCRSAPFGCSSTGRRPIHPDTLSRMMRALPGTRFGQIFGQTEGSPITCLTPDDHILAAAGREDLLASVGRAAPGVELLIDQPDEAGVGEVWARAEHLFLVDHDGWLRTGDLGQIDGEGYLHLAGRKGDRIIRGGENVYPLEVEQVLVEHPGVREAVVVARPTAAWVRSSRRTSSRPSRRALLTPKSYRVHTRGGSWPVSRCRPCGSSSPTCHAALKARCSAGSLPKTATDPARRGEPTRLRRDIVRIGFRPPHALFERGTDELLRVVRRSEQLAIDQVCVGDHVMFNGGQGFDGLVQATALAVGTTRMTVQTTVYLLPLRHPVPVARQVASLALLAPGRFVFGVGVGGEDRNEVEMCGVDPSTRGRRMDEALAIVRPLLAGETVTFDGAFFQVHDAAVLPALAAPVPIVVGGRSAAALRRAGVYGDGWLGVWVSPKRFAAATTEVEAIASSDGRAGVVWRHGLQVWCGFGPDREEAAGRLAHAMEQLYRVPFTNFVTAIRRAAPPRTWPSR